MAGDVVGDEETYPLHWTRTLPADTSSLVSGDADAGDEGYIGLEGTGTVNAVVVQDDDAESAGGGEMWTEREARDDRRCVGP